MSERMLMAWLAGGLACVPALDGVAKEHSRFVSAEMRANALANVKQHEWAQAVQEAAVEAAEPWVSRTDDALWGMVPGQELPRTIYTNAGLIYEGRQPFCPGCGNAAPAKHGRDWWALDEDRPWKIRCRNCGEVYPKNDFAAFYASALDEHGVFRRALGDRSLLINTDHPDPAEPLHYVYVDDGYGMLDEEGNRHDMIACYGFKQWRSIRAGVDALARAYTLTDDGRYAHKAAVLLDRIADVYPEMDYAPLHELGFQHSQGGPGRGRIEGCIWETGVAQNLARSYDQVFDGIQDDEELVAFCAQKAQRYKLGDKGSIGAICRHVQEHLLLEALESVKDGRIAGNTGMTHCALAVCAIALDDPSRTPQWLDWLFDPGFPGEYRTKKDPVPWVLTEGLDRDGMGGECGGYGLIWTRRMHELVDILSAYPEYGKHNLVGDYPKLKQSFLVESRLNVLDAMMPNTGDSGSVGSWGRQGRASTYLQAYRIYRDPRFAELAWREHEVRGASLRLDSDVFQKEPDALINAVRNAAPGGAFALRSQHLGRYGQAYLQTGTPESGRAVFIHYGYGKGHSHHDGLNIGLLAKNVAMIPDLGYPEYTGTWPKRRAWTSNTISHNTLQIGDTRAAYSPGGKIELFGVEPPLRVMQVSAPRAYEGVQTYRRTVALVDVGDEDSYVFDVFRACGGKNHRLSWHGSGAAAEVAGIELVPQKTGTFAGLDAPFATLDGEKAEFYRESGFTYLYDVARSSGPVQVPYIVDWRIEDVRGRIQSGQKPHLRLHALTACDEVALATADPPHNRQQLRYLIQSRLGDAMGSQFVNVLEPYDAAPFIKGVRRLAVEHDADPDSVVAVAVELPDGGMDVLISCEQPTKVTVEGDIVFEGLFGMIRLVSGQVRHMRMCGGAQLNRGETTLEAAQSAWRGKVVRVDASDPEENLVFLEPALPQDGALVGRTIHFVNDLPMDTSYAIRAVTADGVSTGDITTIRGFKNPGDFTAGYTSLVNPGDEYVVPMIVGKDVNGAGDLPN